jgi:nicotinamidase-related amidase
MQAHALTCHHAKMFITVTSNIHGTTVKKISRAPQSKKYPEHHSKKNIQSTTVKIISRAPQSK